MALGWTVLLNVLICCVAAVRWLAVVTALMFIAHPS
jgi:hypothetical protein